MNLSRRARVSLDVASVVLLLGGLTGLAVIAFAVGDRAGWATLSAYAVLGGLFLGLDR